MKNLGVFLRIFISLIAISLVIYFLRDKLGEAIMLIRTEVNWAWFGLGIVVFFIALCVFALRLQHVFLIQQIPINYREASYLNFVGIFFNLIMPSAVGGDIAKAYYAYKHNGNKIASTTSVILDRLLGFVATIAMAVTSLFIFKKEIGDPRIEQFVYIFLGCLVFAIVFFLSKRFARFFSGWGHYVLSEKWKQRALDLYHAIHQYRNHQMRLFWLVTLSFIGQGLIIVVYYCIAQSLSAGMSIWIFFILVPVIFIISMAPSLGGLGVREAGLVYLYGKFISHEKALAISILLDFVIYGYSMACGIIFALKGELKRKAFKEMEEIR